MIHQFEILALHEDLIACRIQRLFQTEELRRSRKVKWTTAALSHDADLILPVAQQLARDRKLTGSAECIVSSDLFGRDRSSIYQQVVSHYRLHFAANAQVIVQRKDHDRRVARVVPLCATPVLNEPVGDR